MEQTKPPKVSVGWDFWGAVGRLGWGRMGRQQTHGKGKNACFPMGFSPEIVTAGSQDNFMNLKHFIIYSEDDIKQLSLSSERGQSLQQRGAVARSRERAFQGAVLVSHAKNRTRETGWFETNTECQIPTQRDGDTQELGPVGRQIKFPAQQPPSTSAPRVPFSQHKTLPHFSSGTADNPAAHTGLQTPPKHLLGPQSPGNVGVSTLSCPRIHPDLNFNHNTEPQLLLLLTTFPACSCWIPCSGQGQPCQPHLILPFCLTPRRGAKSKILHGTGCPE